MTLHKIYDDTNNTNNFTINNTFFLLKIDWKQMPSLFVENNKDFLDSELSNVCRVLHSRASSSCTY